MSEKREKTEEEKARSKRVHALVMMILGAIMSACALAAGLIALNPGAFPSWMTGGWGARADAPYRRPRAGLVPFADFGVAPLARAAAEKKLVLLHLSPWWSREGSLAEETLYSDEKTAAWIAEHAVAVRADPDERPDLALMYGVGAWPSTVLIDGTGRPLAGASRLTPKLFLPWADLIARTLKDDPSKAEGLAADVRRRLQAVRARPEPAAGPDDPVWGGVFRSERDRAKVLADQTQVVLSTDAARAKAVLGFVERFLSLPGGGYAAAVRGDVLLADGRVEEGFSYFAKDDAARRAAGLPAVDRRVLPGPDADMARAVLRSPVATAAQKAHARRTLDFVWTRLVKDGRVCRTPDLCDWPADQWAVVEAELAAGRRDRARKVFSRQPAPKEPNAYYDALKKRLGR